MAQPARKRRLRLDPLTTDAGLNYILLDAAGYSLNASGEWWHPALDRVLDARFARRMTSEQLCGWIAAGVGGAKRAS